jgi:hypothetical protein
MSPTYLVNLNIAVKLAKLDQNNHCPCWVAETKVHFNKICYFNSSAFHFWSFWK